MVSVADGYVELVATDSSCIAASSDGQSRGAQVVQFRFLVRRNQWPHGSNYLPLRFEPPGRLLPAAFLAALAVFLGDFFALFFAVFLVDDEPLPSEKMVSQLSEYCFVAPMRTTLIVD
jgi:hypothetical protein